MTVHCCPSFPCPICHPSGASPSFDTVKETAKIGTGKAGPGRPKGVPNQTTALLKDAILKAAEQAGGKKGLIGYLETQATDNPGPFMALLGKVLPMQVTGADGNALEVVFRTVYEEASPKG